MQRLMIAASVLAVLAGCETVEREPFDPGADERIGEELRRACYPATSASGGGYISIDGYDGFIVGQFNRRYLLVFSRGCGDLGPAGAAAVFRNFGDNCRRQGELVRTFQGGFGVSGACTIDHIYEWDRRSSEEEGTESENGAG